MSTRIVRNLRTVNGRIALAQPLLAEDHRARRLAPDPPGRVGEERRGEHEPDEGPDDVAERLIVRREREALGGRQGDERQALDRVHLDVRTDELVEPRDDVDLDVAVANRADDLDRSLRRIAREGDDRPARRRAWSTSSGSCSTEPSTGTSRRGPARSSCGLRVDEADEVDPVLAVLEELARDELAHVAGADDHRVLEEGELRAGRPRGRRRARR